MRSFSSSRVRLVAVLAVTNVLLAAGGWLLLVGPQRHHAAAASQHAQQAQSEAVQLRTLIAQQHAGQPVIKTADLYRLAQAMPTTSDEPDLLLALDQLAHESGVRVLGISPQAATSGSGYSVLPINLTLSGDYGSLTHLLHRLRGLVSVRRGKLFASGRLFSVTSVTLAPGAGHNETATVSLDAFVFGTAPGSTSTDSTATTSTSTGSTTTTGH